MRLKINMSSWELFDVFSKSIFSLVRIKALPMVVTFTSVPLIPSSTCFPPYPYSHPLSSLQTLALLRFAVPESYVWIGGMEREGRPFPFFGWKRGTRSLQKGELLSFLIWSSSLQKGERELPTSLL